MNVITFEIAQPVTDVCPQWLQFIHAVNALADATADEKPFGNPEREYQDGDLWLEIYAEANVTQATRDNGTEEGVGVIRFEALTDRVRALFAAVAPQFSEANKKLINGKYWGRDRHAGDYYSRKQDQAADASRKLARAKEAGDEAAIRNAQAELEIARYVGD